MTQLPLPFHAFEVDFESHDLARQPGGEVRRAVKAPGNLPRRFISFDRLLDDRQNPVWNIGNVVLIVLLQFAKSVTSVKNVMDITIRIQMMIINDVVVVGQNVVLICVDHVNNLKTININNKNVINKLKSTSLWCGFFYAKNYNFYK